MNCADQECQSPKNLNERFRKFAVCVARFAGTPIAFTLSLIIIVVWAIVGPFFHYSDSWQLVINTSTTIVTFLMVFLIQNMQNRDAKAIHLKLDELIRAMKGARNNLVMLENLSEEELTMLERQFSRIAEKNRNGAVKEIAQTESR
jgi:low affinity Fe/Cu permease